MNVYIAAPFFNARELTAVQRIEQCLTDHGHKFFSPRTQGKPDFSISNERRRVFHQNYVELERADVVLAWIDRLQEADNVTIRRVRETTPPEDGLGSAYFVDSPPLVQPDLGTVWELGAGYALKRPTVLFTIHDDPSLTRLNLMLAESAIGVVYGWDRLDQLCSQHVYRWSTVLQDWCGYFDETSSD